MKLTVTIVITLLMTVPSWAADDAGTVSPFSFGTGARELALGGAALTTVDATSAAFWNPARLAQTKRLALSGFHTRLFDSHVAYQYLGLVVPTLDFGTFGLSVFRLGIDGIEQRDAGNMLLGEIEENRLAFYFAYGRVLAGYDVGLALTMEHHSLGTYSNTSSPGINLSIGRNFEFSSSHLRQISISATGQNLMQPDFRLADRTVKYPNVAGLSLSIDLIPKESWQQMATVSASLTKTDFVDPKWAVGIEYSLNNMIYGRAGMRDGNPAVGIGLDYRALSFDYALVGRDLGSLHLFTITTGFGKTVSEKRHVRAARREEQFSTFMRDRLLDGNQRLVEDLTNNGKTAFEGGDLLEAQRQYDRALFIARSSDLDTAAVSERLGQIQKQLHEVEQLGLYVNHLDSAQARLELGDFWLAQHFASLALDVVPGSKQAKAIYEKAGAALESSTARDKTIEKQLWTIDSLLSYGQVAQAAILSAGLNRLAPDDKLVKSVHRRVQFEQLRRTASAAHSIQDYVRANDALDAALLLFPGHEWCLELQGRIRSENTQKKKAYIAIQEPTPPTVTLTDEVRARVEQAYEMAQDRFKAGDLVKAISEWETVERLQPNYKSTRKHLVRAYRFRGIDLYGDNRLEEALETWKRAIQLAPDNSEIMEYIRRTEAESRRLRELSYDRN